MRRIAIVVAAVVLMTTVATGTMTASAEGQGVPPQRVLERAGLGAPAHRLNPGEVIALPLPTATAAGATAASLNLTATDATGRASYGVAMRTTDAGHLDPQLRAGPDGGQLRHPRHRPGRRVHRSSAPVNVVVDLMGWFTGTTDFRGAAPTRLLDTRTKGDLLKAGVERRLSVAGGAGYQGSSGGVALNVRS